ncbi:MAG: alpha/beta fold hydrolase, partial [Chloroflexi bacterium]|nr:alpha/beta fold hydrolase [Chloroflexota bacterium]
MKATIRGHTLAYDDSGRGRALLFIHGYPLDRTMWQPQMAGLRAHARCVAPDLRGFGASDPPEETSSMEAFATDVVALMDTLGINRAVLCGLSMGGYVALAFAEHWPDRLAGLILANTRAGADSEAGRAARREAVGVAQAQGAGAIAEGLLPKLLAEKTRAEQPEVVAQVRGMMARQPVPGLVAALRGMAARPDRGGLLPWITCPA